MPQDHGGADPDGGARSQDRDEGLDDETLAFAAKVFELARGGDAEAMRDLIDHGLPPNLRNDKGDSLLMLSAYNENEPVVRLLLERGADPDLANDKGQTPLAGVIFKGNIAIMTMLVEHGAAIDGPSDGARSPLMVAAMFDRCDMVEVLLQRGADPDARDAAGLSASDFARSMGAARAIETIESWKRRRS